MAHGSSWAMVELSTSMVLEFTTSDGTLIGKKVASILGENLVTVVAKVQRDGESMSLLCQTFTPLRLDESKVLDAPSRDFH